MGMISLVVGIGLGMFSNTRPGERVAVSIVQNMLRAARNSAVARNAPARVRIDAATGTLRAEGMELIGTWHFESEPVRGAFELTGVALGFDGSALTDDGYQGNALSFIGHPRGCKLEVPVQNDPAYDFTDGFAIEFALRTEPKRGGRLLTVANSVFIETSARGEVKAYFVPRLTDEFGNDKAGGKVWLRSLPAALRPGSWSRVRLDYDRRRFRILVDGVEVAASEEDAPVWRIDGPLVLGGGQGTYPGAIDNLVIGAVGAADEISIPPEAIFTKETPAQIVFAASGELDRDVHKGPIEFAIEYEDGRRQPFRVNLYGTVE